MQLDNLKAKQACPALWKNDQHFLMKILYCSSSTQFFRCDSQQNRKLRKRRFLPYSQFIFFPKS
jgi:hypothetical protein